MTINGVHDVADRCIDAKETVEWYGKYLNMDYMATSRNVDPH